MDLSVQHILTFSMNPSTETGIIGTLDTRPGPQRTCRNCDQPMTGYFCGLCGQQDRDVRQTVLYFLRLFLRVVLDLDGRVYRTLFALLTRPGFLTSEFFAGRRVRYTHPLRLFLVISIGFFLLISGINIIQSMRLAVAEAAINSSEESADDGSADGENARNMIRAALDENIGDKIEFFGTLELPFLSPQMNQSLQVAVSHQLQTNLQDVVDNPRDFLVDSLENITLFLLFMMPILALIQQLLWIFSGRYFVEHLVLILHNETFLVFMSLLSIILRFISDAAIPILSPIADLAWICAMLWVVAYLYLSLKRYFEAGWLVTLVLYSTASIAYIAVLSVGMLAFAALLVLFA